MKTRMMKTMKWIIALFMVAGMALSSYAQQKTPAQQAKQLQAELKLTDEQTAKVTAVYAQLYKEFANDKVTQASLKKWLEAKDKKAITAYMIKQLDVTSARIKPILTAPQKKSFEGSIKKHREALNKM